MGFLDRVLLPSHYQHALRASVNNWRSKVEAPDFENLEESPFDDPHYYSSSESDDDESASNSSNQLSELQRPLIAHAPPLPLPIQIPANSLVMQTYDYGKVVYSQWQDPFHAPTPKIPLSRRYVGATADETGYKRILAGRIRHTKFHLNGSDDGSSDESDDGEHDDGMYISIITSSLNILTSCSD
jgi:hypothetical protein